MVDNLAHYLVQFGTIVAAAMAFSEWATIPVGRKTTELKGVIIPGTRKRWSALLYSFVFGAMGWEAGFVKMPLDPVQNAEGIIPPDAWTWDVRTKAYIGVALLALVSTGAAHLLVAGKKKLRPGGGA